MPVAPTTLQDLSDAWNDLRNRAMGRGATPLVPDALASEVQREYDAWRQWLDSADYGDELRAQGRGHIDRWGARLNALAAKVRNAGVDAPAFENQSVPEAAAEAIERATEMLDNSWPWVLGAVALGAGALLLWRR